MADDDAPHRHFILSGFTKSEPFSPPQRGRQPSIPARERAEHGAGLLSQIEALRTEASQDIPDEGLNLRVEFESFPDIDLAFESLERERSGIELLNVRHSDDVTYATVFVPEGKLEHFEHLIRDYLARRRNAKGRALDHQRLIDAIRAIRLAGLRALWTDSPELFPATDNTKTWWEVWLSSRRDARGVVATFRERATAQGIVTAPGVLQFPERAVLLAFGSVEQLRRSVLTLNSLAELRKPKETADLFDGMAPAEQSAWAADLLERLSITSAEDDPPYVCILDTGVTGGHPLIEPSLTAEDLHTIDPAWGPSDSHGHGTRMAGLALFGDLTDVLLGSDPVHLGHRLESVKILLSDGGDSGDPRHHGYLTTEAVSRPDVSAPARKRTFAMAVTARDARDRGRPSAWSAVLDRLAVDVDGDGARRRLFVVSGGNVDDPQAWSDYPASLDTDGIHDPAQAWNALTVGASTNLIDISEPDAADYSPIAGAGAISPFSTTSMTWDPHWPLKPDVLFEGGNAARDSLGAVWTPSLSLLTTHRQPHASLFTTANATSAACALGARMAAQIMGEYPEFWPETIRGLMVHSAEWTDEMRRLYLPSTGIAQKADFLRLIRRCGFGVPDVDRALWTARNSLTLIVQESLQPFSRRPNRQPTLRDMHLHDLPWPRASLEDLGEVEIEMRVTLSYFIEPNPSARGVRSRYRYPSHGLRFDVRRRHESTKRFRQRINVAARDEEAGLVSSGEADQGWVVGKQGRHKGSVHSDLWRGSAVDLASRGVLAVYPALGWWKTRPVHERYEKAARYAFIVSIRAPGTDVDLYTEVANQIGVAIAVNP